MRSLDSFYSAPQRYVALFDAFAQKHALMGRAEADHVCYKCDSRESFEAWRLLFESASSYVHQAIISNRRIAYIRLTRALPSTLGPIRFLELSDQTPDGSQREGFDHIEAYPTGWTYDELVAALGKTEKIKRVVRPHHTTDDIDIGGGFLFRCTAEALIEKIKREEM